MSQHISQQEMVNAVYQHAAIMMRDGKSDYAIEQDLVGRGMKLEDARVVISQLNHMRGEARRNAGLRAMGIGAVVCIIGIVITLGTYSAAASSPSGGSYVVTWGAIVFGGWQFLRGLMVYLNQ